MAAGYASSSVENDGFGRLIGRFEACVLEAGAEGLNSA